MRYNCLHGGHIIAADVLGLLTEGLFNAFKSVLVYLGLRVNDDKSASVSVDLFGHEELIQIRYLHLLDASLEGLEPGMLVGTILIQLALESLRLLQQSLEVAK